VLARRDEREHLLGVRVVGARHVDDVHRVVGAQRVQVRVDVVDAERPGLGRSALRRGAEHSHDPHADPAQGLDVHAADEPDTDDRGRRHAEACREPRT
jgi:hypothetical protein